jgi:aminoglycoside/choline kinase family phosphotransferase
VTVTGIPIADTPESLSAQWLTEALRSTGYLGERRVTGVTHAPIGTGQMCDCYRLTLHYDGDTGAPSSLVAKLPAADQTSRTTAKALRLYESEVDFYQQLAPQLPVRTPEVFYADQDIEATIFVLLLEDLAPARPGDQLSGCTPAQAAAAISELVRLHAPRWGDESLSSLEWLDKSASAGGDPVSSFLPQLWDNFVARYADVLEPEVRGAGDTLFAHLAGYYLADTKPWTILHGDYRLDNLLFSPDAGPVAVVDWQLCGHGPAMNDVAYFIGAGLLTDVRRRVEHGLVRAYFDDLVASGVTGYDWDRCWRAYRRGTWGGLIIAVASATLVERTERGDQLFLAMATRHARHALDLDAAALITG